MRGAFARPARVVLRRRYVSKSNLPDRLSTLLGRKTWVMASSKFQNVDGCEFHQTEDLRLTPTASKLVLRILSSRDLRGGRGRCALRRSHPCNDVCNTTPFPAESTRFLGGEHLFPLSHPSPPKEPHDFPTMLRSPTFPSLYRRLQYNPFPSEEHTIFRWRAPLFTEPPLSSRGTTRLSDHGFPSL